MGSWEPIKCSLLQEKTMRKSGTLRRKKKVQYGEPCWVLLCVHDKQKPLLEWYHTEEAVSEHTPFKVVSLQRVSYVSHVFEDPRTFVLGLETQEPLELSSIEQKTCSEWVKTTADVLERLEILLPPSYPFCEEIFGYKPKAKPKPTTEMPVPVAAARPQHVKFNSSCENETRLVRPPLPPRNLTGPFAEQKPNYDRPILPPVPQESIYSTLTSPMEDHAQTPQPSSPSREPESPIYSTPRNEIRRSPPTTCSPKRDKSVDSPKDPKSIYDTLSPVASSSNISSSPLELTTSTNSLCSSLSSDLRLSSSQTADTSDYDVIRGTYHHPVKYVSLNLSVLVEHVLFVEVAKRVWVVGWSEAHDKQLSPVLNFGDELVEVEGRAIQGVSELPQLFYNVSTPGTPIAMTFRPTPFGMTYSLIKPINKSKSIGLVFHKKKNRLEDVVFDSSAYRRGLRSTMTSHLNPQHISAAVITDVNSRKLNPFARNEQFYKRLEEVREGCEFTVTVHPHDFIKELKQQIVLIKHYKVFLSL